VGIGTLYRHFPTKESMVDAVYRSQVVRLTTGAHELLDHLPPAGAMRRWMDLFGDWIATKNGMLETLLAMIETGEIAHGQTRTELLSAHHHNPRRRSRDERPPHRCQRRRHRRELIGICTVAPNRQREALVGRLLDLLTDGLRSSDCR